MAVEVNRQRAIGKTVLEGTTRVRLAPRVRKTFQERMSAAADRTGNRRGTPVVDEVWQLADFLPEGAKMPPIRFVQEWLCTSFGSAYNAYRRLFEKGVLTSEREDLSKKVYYVAPRRTK